MGAGSGLAAASGNKAGVGSRKTESSEGDSSQQSVPAAPITPTDPSPNLLLLGLFCLAPMPILTGGVSAPNPDTPDQNSDSEPELGTLSSSSLSAAAAGAGRNSILQIRDLKKTDFDLQASLSAAANSAPGGSAVAAGSALANPTPSQLADLSQVAANLAKAASNTPMGTPAQETVQQTEPASVQTNSDSATQPVFTLAVRSLLSEQPAGVSQQDAAIANASRIASSPSQTSSDQTAVNMHSGSPQNFGIGSISSGSDTFPETQNTSGTNPAEISSVTVPGALGAKPDFAGSNSEGKSGEQHGDKQEFAPIIDSAVPSGANSGAGPQFQVSDPKPVTEYVHPDQTAGAHANTAMTDIRLQLDGAGDQHVNVRLVQEADGLRVTVRSNDPSLTQSLQERVPELTTRLEQHHYQTEVLLPEHTDAGRFSQTNSQQDSSGRNSGSSGQQNPQNKQNQQQNRQAWDEEESFSSLLALRR